MVQREENLDKKVELIDQKEDNLSRREKSFVGKEKEISAKEKDLQTALDQQRVQLERISGMSSEEAKKTLMQL